MPVEIDEIIAVLAKEQTERAASWSRLQHETKPALAAESQAFELLGEGGFGVGDERWKGARSRVAELEGEQLGGIVTVDLARAAEAEGMAEALQHAGRARWQAAQGIDTGALSDLGEARDHLAQASRKAVRESADTLAIGDFEGRAEQCIELCKAAVGVVATRIIVASRAVRGAVITRIIVASGALRGAVTARIMVASGVLRGAVIARIMGAGRAVRGVVIARGTGARGVVSGPICGLRCGVVSGPICGLRCGSMC